jgi:hypothetical protein
MKRATLLLAAVLAVGTITGCLSPTSVDDTAPASKARFNTFITPNGADGKVTVVHGVPGLTVDVYVNGDLTLPSFEPGTVTKPIRLAEGDYEIIIVAEGEDPSNPAISGSVFLPAGANASLVAYLAADGTPSLKAFVNDLSPIGDDDSRIVVRHVAQAGAVDVRLFEKLDEMPVITVPNLENPNEAQADVPSEDYYATISAPGASDPLFVSDRFEADDEEIVIFYAIGNPMDNSFALLSQEIELDEDSDKHDRKRKGTVSIIHGVPGLTVDVYVNGALQIAGFEPGTVTEPMRLPEGDYDIVIVAQGGDPSNPAISGSAFLAARANVSIVAYLAEDGTPSLKVFANDLSKTDRKEARVAVRHVAKAGAVDVRLFRDLEDEPVLAIAGLTNPNEAQADVRSRKYTATISAAGAAEPIFISDRYKVKDEKFYIFYAIGDPTDQTFALLVQVIDLDGRGWTKDRDWDDDDDDEDDDDEEDSEDDEQDWRDKDGANIAQVSDR